MSQLAGNAKQPVHLGVMVRAEQRRELAKLAEREDRSVSSVTRAAIVHGRSTSPSPLTSTRKIEPAV
jgi:hypothetical protein